MPRHVTLEELLRRKRSKTNLNHIQIKLSTFKGMKLECTLRCKRHDRIFDIKPEYLLANKHGGCPDCTAETWQKPKPELHIQRMKETFGDNYKLHSNFINTQEPCEYLCINHNKTYSARPYDVISSKYACCPTCASEGRSLNNTVPLKVHKKRLKLNNPTIKYLKGYLNTTTHCLHKCKVCNYKWEVVPDTVGRGIAGCPACASRDNGVMFSKVSLEWLEGLPNAKYIQHAGNKGEYRPIPTDKRIQVDGYDKKKKTVYEFLGDYWHGNPEVYPNLDVVFRDRLTPRDLIKRDIQRFRALNNLGYTVVYIYERDYYLGNTPKTFTINQKVL